MRKNAAMFIDTMIAYRLRLILKKEPGIAKVSLENISRHAEEAINLLMRVGRDSAESAVLRSASIEGLIGFKKIFPDGRLEPHIKGAYQKNFPEVPAAKKLERITK